MPLVVRGGVPSVIERIVKVFPALLACLCLARFTVGGAQGEPPAFAGFQRAMNLAALLDRYPQSAHEVSPGAGVRRGTSQDDLKGWIREFFRTPGSSGTYVLRMTPGESHDHLYYVQAEVRDGITERLWLLLEMPLDVANPRQRARGNEARYPACNDVLGPLTAKYGKPEVLASRWEEELESFDYVWTRSPEVMKLQCGRYSGRKPVFAIGVTLELTAPR
jgi:hypothetical protein